LPILENPKYEHFAQLVAGGANAAKAYLEAGYKTTAAQQCASRLLTNVQVQARVAELKREISERLKNSSIRSIDKRLDVLQDRWERMMAVILARAADPAYKNEPGGHTGLLVRKMKVLANGATVEDFSLDVALLRELREVETQAAKELGEGKKGVRSTDELVARLNAGRQRVADAAKKDKEHKTSSNLDASA
jgi:hypothetical protein